MSDHVRSSEIEQVIAEMRDTLDAHMHTRVAMRRWAGKIEAVLRRSRAVPPHKHDFAHYEICRVCGLTEAAAENQCHHCNDSMSVKNGRCWWCLRSLAGEAAETRAVLPEPRQHVCTCEDRYNELLLAVVRKYPGESRHETALRYIRQTETREACGPVRALSPDTDTAPSHSSEGCSR